MLLLLGSILVLLVAVGVTEHAWLSALLAFFFWPLMALLAMAVIVAILMTAFYFDVAAEERSKWRHRH